MKKFLGILTIAAALVACDNSASSEQRIKDSTDSARRADSINQSMSTPAPTPMGTDSGAMKMGSDSGMNKMGKDSGAGKMMGSDSGMHK